jgi:hypothetical protein
VFRVIGGNLVAINEVTKKKVASIDLRKAIAVIDLNSSLKLQGRTSTNSSSSLSLIVILLTGDPARFRAAFGPVDCDRGFYRFEKGHCGD